jgi:copper chaperone NosL
MKLRRRRLRLGALALVIACAPGAPEAILFGADGCFFCRMTISDRRFAASLVTTKGRTLKFDSVECLLDYVRKADRSQIASMWVSDFRTPGRMLDVESARFIDIGSGRTPMGRGLAAVASARDAAALDVVNAASIKKWSEL